MATIPKRTALGHHPVEIVAQQTTLKTFAELLPSAEIVEARTALIVADVLRVQLAQVRQQKSK